MFVDQAWYSGVVGVVVLRLLCAGVAALCLPFVLCGQVAPSISIMYWRIAPEKVDDRTARALTDVVEYHKPDVLLVHGFADTAWVLPAFRRSSGTANIIYSYTSRSQIITVANGDVFVGVSTLFNNISGRAQFSIVLTWEGKNYSFIMADWAELDEVNVFDDHFRTATDVLVMAKGCEMFDTTEGRIVVIGTLNAPFSNDPGLRRLKIKNYLFSPLVEVQPVEGQWDSTASFSYLHTTSASSGLARRSAMALVSGTIADMFKRLEIVGNDSAHYQRAVNDGLNSSVPDEIAGKLAIASEHLPLILTLKLDSLSGVSVEAKAVDSLDLR